MHFTDRAIDGLFANILQNMAVSGEAVMDEVGTVPDEVEIEWTPENEVHLFYAMRGHKPVGVAKYFQMACIVEKFRNFANKDVTSKPLWEHLESLYDVQSLDDVENMPFPNEESDFCLPEEEFGDLIQERTKSEKKPAETVEEPVKEVPARKEVTKEAKKSGNKESKKEVKGKDTPKEGKKDPAETKEPKTPKQRAGTKEKEKESADAKRGAKRFARGGNKSDDASSNQSTSPVATPAPLTPLPPQKRRRT